MKKLKLKVVERMKDTKADSLGITSSCASEWSADDSPNEYTHHAHTDLVAGKQQTHAIIELRSLLSFSTDKTAAVSVDHLERTSKVYVAIAHRSKQVLAHVSELALDHSSISVQYM